MKMESLLDAFSFDELSAFDKRVADSVGSVIYSVEPKIDGLSVSLEYENGVFVRGVVVVAVLGGGQELLAQGIVALEIGLEGGGQLGDTGRLILGEGALHVTDTKKTDGVYVHLCTMESGNGILRVGDTVRAEVEVARRESIMRNHSACHLLQYALRTVLGTHVEQAGSYVSDTVCRFDFAHFAALLT